MEDLIVRRVSGLMIPLIVVYGAYIILHGHLTPGGGFQGGVVIGAALILLAMVFGLEEGKRKMSERFSTFTEGFIIFYALIGFAGLVTGANYLANKAAGIPLGKQGELLSSGAVILLNIVVGIKVLSTVKFLFYRLAEGDE